MKVVTVFLALLLPTVAADPEGFAMYKASEIQARARAAKLDEHKAGVDRVATWGNHGLMMVRREGNGAVETHETQADIITVMSGEGTLVVGGTMVDGKTTAPNEIRGKSINGGVSKPMAAGDVFHIPAKIPHQMLVPKSLVIQVVKVIRSSPRGRMFSDLAVHHCRKLLLDLWCSNTPLWTTAIKHGIGA